MKYKQLFFCIMPFCSFVIANSVEKPLVQDTVFTVYQAAVRHALIAWQNVEQGIVEESQLIELTGRLALIKYFFEQAQDDVVKTMYDDGRFWVHLTDHILIHLHRSSVGNDILPFVQKLIKYIQKKCTVNN